MVIGRLASYCLSCMCTIYIATWDYQSRFPYAGKGILLNSLACLRSRLYQMTLYILKEFPVQLSSMLMML